MRGLICLLLLWVVPARGSELQLAEVLESVESRFPLVIAVRQDRVIADAEKLAADGQFDPLWRSRIQGVPAGYYQNFRLDSWLEFPTPLWGLTAFAGYRLTIGALADYDGKLATGSAGEVRAGLQLPLWRNGPIDRRRANIRRAEIGRGLADASLQQQRLESLRNASQRYWDWVAAGQRLKVARDLYEIAKTRDEALRVRVDSGDLPNVERVDNQRAIVARQALVVQAERGLEQSAIELSLFLRNETGPLRPSAERLPSELPESKTLADSQLDASLATALTYRPEIKRMRSFREQQAVEIRWARNQLAPQIDAFVATSYDLGETVSAQSKPEVEGGVFLEIPLGFRAARGRVKAVRAEGRKIDEQLQFTIDRVTNEVRDSFSAVRAAHQRAQITRAEVKLAHELERAERTKFDLGDSTLLFVNLREQAAAEAELRLVDSLADYHKAKAAYDAAKGDQ